MKRFFFYSLIFILSSCSPVPTQHSLPTITAITIEIQPTSTRARATSTVTPVPPTRTSTSTPEPCDPLQADYCVTEGHFVFQRPIQPPANTIVDYTYRFASDFHNTREPHHGVEFLNKFGTPVYAAGDGVVIFAGPDQNGQYGGMPNFYGNVVVIQHTADLFTLYAHLSKIEVQVEQEVAAGDPIGEVGQSGAATGPHLHFEVRQGDVVDYYAAQNPELWLLPDRDQDGQMMGALQVSILNDQGELVRFAEISLQQYIEQDKPTGSVHYDVTYRDPKLMRQENFGISDLPAGRYRLVVKYSGSYYERWVDVQSDRLTQVVFKMKY